MAQTEGGHADGSRSFGTHPGVARRRGGMAAGTMGGMNEDARRCVTRTRGKTTVIATVTRLVRRIIGAVEVFGGEDAGGEEVGARARDVSGERRGLGGARGKEDDGARDDGEGAQGEGGDDVHRGLGGRDAREVSRSIGRSARGVASRLVRRAREARERRGTRSTRERTATACARALGESSMWVNAAHHAATIAAPMVPARGETRELGTVSRASRDTRAHSRSRAPARASLSLVAPT